MPVKQISNLVIFCDEFYKAMRIPSLFKLEEYDVVEYLHVYLANNLYTEVSKEEFIQFHSEKQKIYIKHSRFYDIQLKFFLLRLQPKHRKREVRIFVMDWLEEINPIFKNFNPFSELETSIRQYNRLHEIDFVKLVKSPDKYPLNVENFNQYALSPKQHEEYIKRWQNGEITLIEWEENDFINIINILLINRQLNILEEITDHVKKLFDEKVEKTIKENYWFRLTTPHIVYCDKCVLRRVFENRGTSNDIKYVLDNFNLKETPNLKLFQKCTKFIKTEDISFCDIHNPNNRIELYTVTNYFEKLFDPLFLKQIEKEKKSNKERNEPALWFDKIPLNKKKKEDFFYKLESIFNHAQPTQKFNWEEFKNIFNEKGCTHNVTWQGSHQVLRLIIVELGDTIKFRGKKWEVVKHYFEFDKDITAKTLATSNKYKNPKLSAMIKELNNFLK